jgi:hypothetical protein
MFEALQALEEDIARIKKSQCWSIEKDDGRNAQTDLP